MFCQECNIKMERYDATKKYNYDTKKYELIILYFCPKCGTVKAEKRMQN